MSFSADQEQILYANGWELPTTCETNKFIRGNEWVSIAGNIVNWSGRCKTYNPSFENFEKWAMLMPVYFDPAIKAKMIAEALLK